MGLRSEEVLFICIVMILSIFSPTVMGGKGFESENKSLYRQYAINGFQDSNIHSELRDLIEKSDKAELAILVVIKPDKDRTKVEKALKNADGKTIKYHKLAKTYSANYKFNWN